MTDHPSRIRGTAAKSNPPSAPADSSALPAAPPGARALLAALGIHGVGRLRRQRGTHGPIGALADLVWNTACEVDYLHAQLYSHAADVQDWLEALMANPGATFTPTDGAVTHFGHVSDLHAALLVQQMSQLSLVLKSYQAANGAPRA
ncbi:hypothetical protein AB0J25_28520 [Streptomyces sp. NPDC049910]|uniref:hypothetical protein n=1 Tax=Streptomyces sp. NPDC049910 TaxID=3155278 RepID=UPI00342D5260